MRFNLNSIILNNLSCKEVSVRFYHNIIKTKSTKCILKNEIGAKFLSNVIHPLDIFYCDKRQCSSTNSDVTQTALELFYDDEVKDLVPRSLRLASMPHQVFIVHPYIKWGPKKKQDTSPDLQLEEAVSIIKTLHDWKIVGKKKISLLSFDKESFFNKGQLEIVKTLICKNQLITSVFVNVKSLKINQHLFLEDLFSVPVFDRYSIVMNIFKRHAVTKEAKLQVSLAEIPFIRSRIRGINELDGTTFIKNTGIGSGETIMTKRLKALSFYEQQVKKSIDKLRQNRELLRKKRRNMEFPIVAVVGYTNAGKTSLIKCLTEEEKMNPEDKLFATLDVTVHAGTLPCNLKVLYVDTIGFISDLPTNLLEPFIATLEDAIQADLIVHVQDISHPDHVMQKSHVLKTLESFNLRTGVMQNIISVGNKCDKVPTITTVDNDLILTSCTKNTGLSKLEEKIETGIINALNLKKIRIRVINGGREYFWLQKETAISNCFTDENNQQYVFLDVLISNGNLEKFKSYFIRR
ncbi:putative GTP-binding protein 6 [Halyomorpha halys]|uniref:putative GTP-binding protein 6 n=1 Tax=Halyomorpha halys TaxID=286706 RepID=UPI0006D4D960|nr:putative GTP-binding protein 6 [Halyomorpha halys]